MNYQELINFDFETLRLIIIKFDVQSTFRIVPEQSRYDINKQNRNFSANLYLYEWLRLTFLILAHRKKLASQREIVLYIIVIPTWVIGLITGHCNVGYHLNNMDQSIPKECRLCGYHLEEASHIFSCP